LTCRARIISVEVGTMTQEQAGTMTQAFDIAVIGGGTAGRSAP